MSVKDKIQKELINAMRSKDKLRSAVLKSIKAEILKEETSKNASEVDEAKFQLIIKKMVKTRKQSIEEYKKVNRSDLVDSELAELKILDNYLPVAVTQEEIIKVIDEVIASIDEKPQIGKIMGQIMAKFKGQNIDGGLVSKLVKESLG